MPDLPQASTQVSDRAAASARGLETCCVIAPVALNPDFTPRPFSETDAIFEQHGYSEGLEYSAFHFDGNGKPVLFVGVPISTPGAISRHDVSGNTGSSVTTINAVASGCLTEHEGVLSVIQGGVVGTDQIVMGLSLDGGFKTVPIRFGTGNSYTEPLAGVQILLGAGTLVTNQIVHTWKGSSPRASASDVALAFTA